MNLRSFRRSLEGDDPPEDLSPAMNALWYGARGDWERAHRIVQDESDPEAAWVHAWLHRVEGDLDNARYWYGQAGRDPRTEPTGEEWQEIVTTLVRRGE